MNHSQLGLEQLFVYCYIGEVFGKFVYLKFPVPDLITIDYNFMKIGNSRWPKVLKKTLTSERSEARKLYTFDRFKISLGISNNTLVLFLWNIIFLFDFLSKLVHSLASYLKPFDLTQLFKILTIFKVVLDVSWNFNSISTIYFLKLPILLLLQAYLSTLYLLFLAIIQCSVSNDRT